MATKAKPNLDYEFLINNNVIIHKGVSHHTHRACIQGDLKQMVKGLVYAMEADKKILKLVTSAYKSYIVKN